MDNIEFKPNHFVSEICDKMGKFKNNLIEKQLEKLIKPYVDVKKFGVELSAQILKNKGYEIKCVDDGINTRYLIRKIETMKEDFFIAKNNIEIKQEGNSYKAVNYISDIVRNIKLFP